ncbi:MAG: hypothetical protein AB7P02_15335 [Alphaproteobacteria bacterium]
MGEGSGGAGGHHIGAPGAAQRGADLRYPAVMTARRDPSRTVLESIENDEANRCVDLFRRTDGTWGFEECRRDPEDGGRWTTVGGWSGGSFPSRDAAFAAACGRIPWLAAATLPRTGAATSERLS